MCKGHKHAILRLSRVITHGIVILMQVKPHADYYFEIHTENNIQILCYGILLLILLNISTETIEIRGEQFYIH